MPLKTDEIFLRPYQPADAEPITRIYAHYVQNSAVTFDIEAPGKAEMAQKLNTLQKAGHPLIVASGPRGVLGYAYASAYRPRPAYRFTCENAIYIAPDACGQGLGSLLMDALLGQARAFGFNQMVAIITGDAQSSIALHKKFGFKIMGEFPELGFKFSKWHAIVHMQLKL